MSAGSNLQGGGGQTLEQRIANIEAALRGGPPVIDALGAPTDDDVDLGSALNAWRDVFANGLVVGGARVDIAAVAGSAPVYAFGENDPTFSWPGNRTTALILLWSAGSGGGGGGSSSGLGSTFGFAGDPGAATTATIGGMTYSSGAAPGGPGGAQGGVVADGPGRTAMPGGPGGVGGIGINNGQVGFEGTHVLSYFTHSGLSEGDTLSIVVPSGGAGGIGGVAGNNGTPGEAGSPGRAGMAIILALL